MRWFKDERGVSPVIGVILMVAITVILAAVIASFVFGLGSKAPKSTPQVQLSAEITADNTTIITHNGGEPVKFSDLNASVTNVTAGVTATGLAVTEYSGDGDDIFEVGEKAEINTTGHVRITKGHNDEIQVIIVHNPTLSTLLKATVYS